MAGHGPSHRYDVRAQRIQEVDDVYEEVGNYSPSSPGLEQPVSSNEEKNPRKCICTIIIAASMLVLFGLAVGGTIFALLEKMKLDEMKKMNEDLVAGAESCSELRDKYGILKSGTYQIKQNGSDQPVRSYCDFQLRTGNYTCEGLLNGLGIYFEVGYFWIHENQTSQPSFKRCFKGPSSCMELMWAPRSGGIVNIYPTPGSLTKVKIFCDQDGWTVFQRRNNGSVDFYRGWDEYVNGFGDMNGEFWLGLETIYQLTKDGDYELRVDLEDFDGNKSYAKYGHFSISSAFDEYRLSVSCYFGNAGNSLDESNGMRFSTYDNDNDKLSGTNCSVSWQGAWWYNACHKSNLNGKYNSSKGIGAGGVVWYFWKGEFEYLKYTEMKFKKKN